MAVARTSRTGVVLGALVQVAAGLAAHTAAAGCLPAPQTLALALPPALLLLIVVGAALPGRPLRALAVGQLGVHGVVALAGCAGAVGHVHAGAAHLHAAPGGLHDPRMVLAHVVALAVSMAVVDRATGAVDRAAQALRRLVRRWLGSPVPAVVAVGRTPRPCPAPRRLRRVHLLAAAPRRGPPPAPGRRRPA